MKTLFLSILVACVAMLVITSPILACWGEEVSVEIDIDGPDAGYLGDTVTVIGTVTITAIDIAPDFGGKEHAEAYSFSEYTINSSNGSTVVTDNNSQLDVNSEWYGTSANASAVYTWSYNLFLSQLGDYTASFYGLAAAELTGSDSWVYQYSGNESITIKSIVRPMYLSYSDWYNNGQFEVCIGGLNISHQAYLFSNGVLIEDVNQWGWSNGKTIWVKIPKGTAITGTEKLMITYDPYGNYPVCGTYNIEIPQDATFSNPVEINDHNGDNIMVFSEIVDGILQ